MIVAMLRRDPAVRVLPVMVVGFAVLGWVAGTAQLERGPAPPTADAGDLAVDLLMVTVWAVINYFAVGKMHEIATPFEMAMPVDARVLWGARLIAMTSTVCSGVTGFIAGYALRYGGPFQPYQLAVAFNITAFTALIPFVYTSVRVRAPKWGMPLPVFLALVAALVWGCAQIGLQTYLPGLLAISGAVTLAATTFARLPKCFELPADTRAATPPARSQPSRLVDAASLAWLEGVPGMGGVVRLSAAMRPPAWFTQSQRRLLIALVLLVNVFALSLSPLVLLLVLVLAQFAWFTRTVNGGSRLAPLPVPRDRIFLAATVPGLVVAGIIAAGLVVALPDLTWGRVLASKQAALGFALYAFAWWFTLSLVLDSMTTPALRKTPRVRRFLRAKYGYAALLVLALTTASALERTRSGESVYFWEISRGRSSLHTLAEAIPTNAPLLWGLTLLCGLIAFVLLRRGFRRAELVPATDF